MSICDAKRDEREGRISKMTFPWIRFSVGALGVILWIMGILETFYPTARWLNCGVSVPYLDQLFGPPTCAWDPGGLNLIPYNLIIPFCIFAGEGCLLVSVMWELGVDL